MIFRLLLPPVLCVLLPAWCWGQVPVQIARLGDVLVDLDRRAPAEVMPLNEARIAAEVAAVVTAVHADVGQEVPAGELLLQLDERDYVLALRQAEAALDSRRAQKARADARLERARELGLNQYLSADELQERETDVSVLAAEIRAAEVAVAIARRALEKCRLAAPFHGVVVERQAQVGSYVAIGAELVRFTQVDAFELDAEIPAETADSLAGARSFFEAQGRRWPVELLRISPIVDNQRRTRRARYAFPESAPPVGASGELVWHIDKGSLPSHLVSRREGVLGVFLHEEGRAVFTPLPGAEEGRPAPVDLPADSEVIVMGRDRLQDGDAVAIES